MSSTYPLISHGSVAREVGVSVVYHDTLFSLLQSLISQVALIFLVKTFIELTVIKLEQYGRKTKRETD